MGLTVDTGKSTMHFTPNSSKPKKEKRERKREHSWHESVKMMN